MTINSASDHGASIITLDVLNLPGVQEKIADLTAQRDMARDVAVQLEQQVAAVRSLHGPLEDQKYGFRTCDQCSQFWPCETVRILDGDES